MKKFEYRVITIAMQIANTEQTMEENANEIQEIFNQLGVEGWEFVEEAVGYYYFKRELLH